MVEEPPDRVMLEVDALVVAMAERFTCNDEMRTIGRVQCGEDFFTILMADL